MKNIIYIAIIWFISIAGNVSAETAPKLSPFAVGEKLTYTLRWGVVHAGEATLEVLPTAQVSGKPALHFVMTARSNSFLDAIYKVRDRIDAYTDPDIHHSIYYRKQQKEGSHEKDIIVRFDWDKSVARYTNFGNPRDPLPLKPGTFDPLSAFYYTRTQEMAPGILIDRPITDGKKAVIGRVTVVRRETLKTEMDTFDTFLIEPELKHIGGVFRKSDKAKLQIWVTADHRKIPVRIRSKVIIGSFIGDLKKIETVSPVSENQPETGQKNGSTSKTPGSGSGNG